MTLRLKNGKLAHKMLLAPVVVEECVLRQGPCENCACQLVTFRHACGDVYAVIEPRPRIRDVLDYPDYLFIAEHTPDRCRRTRRNR